MVEPSSVAWGLDIAGHSTGKSGLARAMRQGGQISVQVHRGHPLAAALAGDDLLEDQVAREVDLLRRCLEQGHLYVDIPIDLQGLPSVATPRYPWQLCRRPVDQAVGGMPPLADRIGAPVARFRYLLRRLEELIGAPLLGARVFETYPAASLKEMGLHAKGYKGKSVARFVDGAWSGEDNAAVLAKLAMDLGLHAAHGTSLTDDDLDAVVCALSGLGAQFRGPALLARVEAKLGAPGPTPWALPAGYVLLTAAPSRRIDVEVREEARGLQAVEAACLT
jgi:hypothetical protein